MKDTRPAAYRKHINKLVSYFKDAVFAGEYATKTEFVATLPHQWDAMIEVSPMYLWINLKISDTVLERWKAGDWWWVADAVCHEMCHVLTEPLHRAAQPAFTESMRVALIEINERQTQRISNAILNLTPEKVWNPKFKGGSA